MIRNTAIEDKRIIKLEIKCKSHGKGELRCRRKDGQQSLVMWQFPQPTINRRVS
jgi:hypothetical protein